MKDQNSKRPGKAPIQAWVDAADKEKIQNAGLNISFEIQMLLKRIIKKHGL